MIDLDDAYEQIAEVKEKYVTRKFFLIFIIIISVTGLLLSTTANFEVIGIINDVGASTDYIEEVNGVTYYRIEMFSSDDYNLFLNVYSTTGEWFSGDHMLFFTLYYDHSDVVYVTYKYSSYTFSTELFDVNVDYSSTRSKLDYQLVVSENEIRNILPAEVDTQLDFKYNDLAGIARIESTMYLLANSDQTDVKQTSSDPFLKKYNQLEGPLWDALKWWRGNPVESEDSIWGVTFPKNLLAYPFDVFFDIAVILPVVTGDIFRHGSIAIQVLFKTFGDFGIIFFFFIGLIVLKPILAILLFFLQDKGPFGWAAFFAILAIAILALTGNL